MRQNVMPKLLRVALAAAAVVSAATFVSAAEPAGGAMANCRADLATLCPGIEAGGGKKVRCLAEHRTNLSESCAAALSTRLSQRTQREGGTDLAQAQQAPAQTASPPAQSGAPAPTRPAAQPLRASMRACRTDIATLCADTQAGGGRKIKCLMENQSKLSAGCAAAVAGAAQARSNARAVCAADAAKFCGTARGPERWQCLTTHQAELAPDCAGLVAQRAARDAKKAGIRKE